MKHTVIQSFALIFLVISCQTSQHKKGTSPHHGHAYKKNAKHPHGHATKKSGKHHHGTAKKKAHAHQAAAPATNVDARQSERRYLSRIRRLTYTGKRSGEGYYSANGKSLVFQSERDPNNPFYQIFIKNLVTGTTRQVSPGHGKTTCAWIHPDGKRVMYASTHEDPTSLQKQQTELDFRKSGKARRYSWDYDPSYELYVTQGHKTKRLTFAQGYDAEGSYSPDGKWIAFASNRRAYSEKLTNAEKKLLTKDKSYFIDIYLMRANGKDLRRLTTSKGYDGGPFFSPDGKRIVWRRFSKEGHRAEIYSMKLDGSDQRRLTTLNVMSWAPYYHPSNKYIIFATNLHGYKNFELYVVDVAGKKKPVRVTFTDGFDGLPVFSPNGRQLAFTTARSGGKGSQLFLADWDHTAMLRALGSDSASARQPRSKAGKKALKRIKENVITLSSQRFDGRQTGTAGNRLATSHVKNEFIKLGLKADGDLNQPGLSSNSRIRKIANQSFFQTFSFKSGVAFGSANTLTSHTKKGPSHADIDRDWRPLAFSQSGSYKKSEIVFAGYGIRAPKGEKQAAYDNYTDLDVAGKWVLVLRFIPEDVSPERRQYLSTYASFRYKTMVARDLKAKGLIIVAGPNSAIKHELIATRFDASLSGASIPVVSITRALAGMWLKNHDGSTLKKLQTRYDKGNTTGGFVIKNTSIAVTIDIKTINKTGRNVIARLKSRFPNRPPLVIGAHVDHLGHGKGGSSLARGDEKGKIHFGADDNASGVAAMLEIAHLLTRKRRSLARDVIFAAWSGEELGLLGSTDYVRKHLKKRAHAYLNFDMVGRLRDTLVLQGIGSSSQWPSIIETINVRHALPIVLQNESYLPTDASAFYTAKTPILAAFTGAHAQYHTPRDTADTLNFPGIVYIAQLMGDIALKLASEAQAIDYVVMTKPKAKAARGMRVYMGSIPDYTYSGKGVRFVGVAKEGPVEKAGVKGGDVLVKLAGRKIDNLYDYMYALNALKGGQEVTLVVVRQGTNINLKVTPLLRE